MFTVFSAFKFLPVSSIPAQTIKSVTGENFDEDLQCKPVASTLLS